VKSKRKFPKHRAWLRSQPCVRCGAVNHIEAAHLRRGTDGGTGMKPSDCYAYPCCTWCHKEEHQKGNQTFCDEIDLTREFVLKWYWQTSPHYVEGVVEWIN
jgi:hypothetical protein